MDRLPEKQIHENANDLIIRKITTKTSGHNFTISSRKGIQIFTIVWPH